MVKQWLLKFSGCILRRGSCLVIFATALMVVTAGLWMARQSGREVDLRMRRDLARQAADIASAVNPVHVKDLSFSADDKASPVFQRLSAQMRDYAGFTGVKTIYTMALRNGQIVFGPESLPEGHPYASPPGTVYQEPSQKDFNIFTTGRPQVQGPVSDEYGTFVTASAPVFDPYSGEVVAVIGIDVEASVWRAAVRRAQWLPAQLTLILLLILLLSGLIIRYRQHHSPERKERRHYTETILSVVFLSLMTWVAAKTADQTGQESRCKSFHQQAQTYAAARAEELNDLQDRLDQLVAFFQSSKNISREEFSSYCNPIIQDEVVTACVWLPAVKRAEIPSFLQKARDAGWPDFSIWQKNKNGINEPVALRPVYYPALYIAPLAGHETAVGYDLYSEPVRHAAMQETLRTGLPTATDPVKLIALTNAPLGFFIFQPVNTSTHQGLAAFAVRPESLLGEAPHHNKKLGIEICLFQLKPRGESVFMAGSSPQCGPACFADAESGLGITVPVFRFGKTYAIRLIPDEAWLADHPLRQGWIAGLLGLLITILFSSVVALITNRHAALERKVESRTAELKISEALRINILTHIGSVVVIIDQDGINRYKSPNIEKWFGWKPDEVVGTSALENVHPADVEAAQKFISNLMTGPDKTGTTECRYRCKDGRYKWIAFTGVNLLHDPDIRGILGNYQDITERRKMAEALSDSEEKFRSAIEGLLVGVVVHDADSNILLSNPQAEKILGLRAGEMVGKNVNDSVWHFVCEDLSRMDVADYPVNKVLSTEAPVVDQILGIQRPNSEQIRWVCVSAVPVFSWKNELDRVVVNFLDITDRKRDEKDLQQREAYLSSIIENQSGLIWLKDTESRFLTVNQVFATACGCQRPADVEGKTDFDVWPAELAEKYHRDDQDVMEKRRAVVIEESICDKGEIRWFETYKAPVFSAQGKVIGTTGYARDITDRKTATEQIEFQAQILEQIKDMITVTDLQGGISYVNDAVCRTLGRSREELLGQPVESFGDDPVQREIVRQTLASGEWCGEVVNRTADGRELILDCRTRIWRDAGGLPAYLVGISSDITGRKKAERKIAEQEQYYRALFAASLDALFIADAQTGQILDANPQAEKLIGRSRDEILQMNQVDLHSDPDAARRSFQTHMREFSDIPILREGDVLHRDGTHIPVEINAGLAEIGGRTVAVGSFHDVRERKAAGQMLMASEKQKDLILNASAENIIYLDLDMKILWGNRTAAGSIGMTPNELVGRHCYELWNGCNEPCRNCPILEAIKTGVPQRGEQVTSDGRIWNLGGYPVLDDNGRVIALVEIGRDVTNERQVEQRIQESEARLSLAAQAAGIGVWDRDVINDVLVWDKRMFEIYGVNPDAFVGAYEAWQRGLHPDDLARAVGEVDAAERGKKAFDTEFRIVRPDGEIRHIKAYAQILRDDFGKPLRMIGVNYDITERKQAEERIRQLAQHLQDVREDERKRLSRELHDDIGQILTAIKIDLVVIKDECTCSGEVKDKMRDMQNLLSEGVQCVHTLCRRLRPGALDDLGLEEALSGLIDDWKQRNHMTCGFHADMDEEGLSDEIRTTIFRMVQEALTNVSRYAGASKVEVNLVADEKMIHVSITDNGCGMEAGAESKPTSFGLLGMRERIEALGGEFFITSASGKWTCIEGSIPLQARGGCIEEIF
jgi:PAS domain S-box-containing protein